MKTPPPESLADPLSALLYLAAYTHTVWVVVAGVTAVVASMVVVIVREPVS